MTPHEINLKLVELRHRLDEMSQELGYLIAEHYTQTTTKRGPIGITGPPGQEGTDGDDLQLDDRYPVLQRRLLPDAISDLNNSNWDTDDPIHYKRYQRLKGSIRNALILNKVDRMPFKEEPKWNVEMLKNLNQ